MRPELPIIIGFSRILEIKPYLRPFKAFSEVDLEKQAHAKRFLNAQNST
jgi:hypothetical protein